MAPQSGAVPLKSWIAVKAESVCAEGGNAIFQA